MEIPITLYTRWQDEATGLYKPMRRNLVAEWDELGCEIAKRTGQILRESTFIKIALNSYDNIGYVTPDEWNKLAESELHKHWTVEPYCIVVKRDSDFEFNYDTIARTQSAENDFIRDTYRALRAVQIDDNSHKADAKDALILLRA